MDAILIKIFATALTFSQVATTPDAVKTQFDPVGDQQQVVGLLRAGCAQMRKAFDIEDLKVDDLVATAMDDPDAISGGYAAFRGINIRDLHTAYRQFCKNETVAHSPVDIGEVIGFYNRTLADLPDHSSLKGMRLPGASVVLDRKGERIAEVFEQDHRRVWVPLAEIPAHVQQAFVAAEDKRFYQHRGVDERSLIRAFIGNLAQSGRPQGGSTITQQVVKNLLVGEDVTYERKMREMILASRIEHTLTKPEILELYLNSTFLGRGSWGVEMAARSYFGTPVSALSVGEAALMAGLTKGPNYFNPDRNPGRAKERFTYVLGRMQEDGAISPDQMRPLTALPRLVATEGRGATPLPLHRLPRAGSQVDRRPRRAHRRFLYGALDHQSRTAAGDRAGLAGRAGTLRDRRRPRPVPVRRGEPRGRGPTHRDREIGFRQVGVAAGARRRAAAAL